MKLPHICFIMNTINDLSESTALKLPNNASELRKHVNMLIIDDNDFYPEAYLRANGYQIQHKADIDTIKDVEPYDIILCDISGVGKKLGYEKEGAFIIREIHANYPCKRIIAYTANTYNADYNKFFSLADFVATKDFGIDNWIDALDDQIRKSINPVTQWKKIRSYLLDKDISTLTVAKIEDKFVSAVNKKNFDGLKAFTEGKDSLLNSIISDFLSSLCAKIILGLLGGHEMSLLPYIDINGELKDGAYFHLLPYCHKNCTKEKCVAHYESLKSKTAGCYCCPVGLSTYVYDSPKGRFIFSGLRIKGSYDKKKAKVAEANECIYNPVIDEIQCSAIATETVVSMIEKQELATKLDAIRDLLHETRSLNGQIKDSIDTLWELNASEEDIAQEELLKTITNAHVCSYMITNRFAYFDSILNPTLSIGSPYSATVFKKFDKMRKLLKDYMRKNVWITISSDPTPCTYRYEVYSTFETLLFILLENAIKYSPNNKPVEVKMCEKGSLLDISIESIGPYNDENELLHLCEKGFRGENAKVAQSKGQGFGLSFAKKICEAHSIEISFSSTYSHKDHGIKYGIFTVNMHLDNSQFADGLE